jgi:hypothetical protein
MKQTQAVENEEAIMHLLIQLKSRSEEIRLQYFRSIKR